MRLEMPELFSDSVIDYCGELAQVDFSNESEIVYDYSRMGTFRPFGMLVMASKLRELMRQNSHCYHKDANFKRHTYAGTMGFFQSIKQDYGKNPGEASGNSNYVPMTVISLKDLRKLQKTKVEHIGNAIEREAIRLSTVLSRGNSNVHVMLSFLIREIMRNVVEHSGSSYIWIAAQHWPSKNEVEVALLDEGIGIMSSLQGNPKLAQTIDTDWKAMKYALEPGISRVYAHRDMRGDVWDNSGYGLYMASRICDELGGSFILLSGDCALWYEDGKKNCFESCFKGTAICMTIRTDKFVRFSELQDRLLRDGERKAKKMPKIAIRNEGDSEYKSKSRMITDDDEI